MSVVIRNHWGSRGRADRRYRLLGLLQSKEQVVTTIKKRQPYHHADNPMGNFECRRLRIIHDFHRVFSCLSFTFASRAVLKYIFFSVLISKCTSASRMVAKRHRHTPRSLFFTILSLPRGRLTASWSCRKKAARAATDPGWGRPCCTTQPRPRPSRNSAPWW